MAAKGNKRKDSYSIQKCPMCQKERHKGKKVYKYITGKTRELSQNNQTCLSSSRNLFSASSLSLSGRKLVSTSGFLAMRKSLLSLVLHTTIVSFSSSSSSSSSSGQKLSFAIWKIKISFAKKVMHEYS